MTLIKNGLLAGLGVVLSACGTNHTQTTLFDGQVTYCQIGAPEALVRSGKTGVLGIDVATQPSLEHINSVLKPYGWVYMPVKGTQAAWVPSGIKAWDRVCDVKLPEAAIAYSGSHLWLVDPSFDRSEALPYPDLPELKDKFNLYNQLWFDGDKLVHVEVRIRPRD